MTDLIKPIDEILRVLIESKEFRKEFSQVADDIVDKIYFYFSNPSPENKNYIIKWIEDNKIKTNDIISNNINLFEVVLRENQKVELIKPQIEIPKNPLIKVLDSPLCKIGKVFSFERSEVEYENLIKKSITEGWQYRGCSVVSENIDNKVIWTVTFY